MLTIVPQLRARLPLHRHSQAGVHIRGGTAPESVGCGGVCAFFAMATQNVLVVSLAGYFGDVVWLEGAVGWGTPRWKGLG